MIQEPALQEGIGAFADSSIAIGLRYRVLPQQSSQALFKVTLAVHKALAEAGRIIPFPQPDVYLILADCGFALCRIGRDDRA